ncbi:mRNA-degrading endonuclease RelE of RelBE toxin-antitoxin system [Bradyrhizobium japonicum]|uniref:3'-5' exonuclease n=1 Tax=Bradyrhizobium japonicum TaxID=375 RepID=UPI0022269B92|nr:3'-5' exonuclease [Bradyrhizobium japonicum]MCW2225698.1 mRNA-degrading endonuclease RelE of RelBE toxin-antitoxin system [Bradyrhizobium japonicum]MCW2340910.1 mRNA-degrading endonuclease RelE of RelBE toxin-antitoxin system [Bradyrhizobium japonicum]
MTEFRISDTFTDSLARLTGEEQKAVKTTAFDLQLNPANPGMSFHKLDKARDKNFWSVRVNSDIRLIVHRSQQSLLLCYVDHHDKAYEWAERRKLEVHPKTGAAQLVEIRETVKEVLVPIYVQTELPLVQNGVQNRALFTNVSDDELLSYGVPTEWLEDVRRATEDTLLILAGHLPAEAAEALLELATGGKPRRASRISAAYSALEGEMLSRPSTAAAKSSNEPTEPKDLEELVERLSTILGGSREAAFDHPDAQRRFRTITSAEELRVALDYPWEKWTIFLHPDQRDLVERDYAGPARVSGSAGTGKTIVALHRAAHLARAYPNARVLLTTFSDTLASALQAKLRRLLGNEPRLGERIDVHSLNSIGLRLYKSHIGQPAIATADVVSDLIGKEAAAAGAHKFSLRFLMAEWDQVVDAWQLKSWEAYRDVARLGRKTRLPEMQRRQMWSILERVQAKLRSRQLITWPELFSSLAAAIGRDKPIVFDCAVVDEAQDVSPAHLRFLAALSGDRANGLFFAGDLGQRIFQQPFSWKSLGIDIRGRSRTLRVNYRTSHQIRTQADRLLGPSVTDADGNTEKRDDAVSVFNGPEPTVLALRDETDECKAVGRWIAELIAAGVLPHEFGVFVRSEAQLDRARAAVMEAGLEFRVLDDRVETASGQVSIATMHLAKGLEFRAVAVMSCDDEVIPLQERIENVGDDADLQEVYETERHLLYVACTRARDHLLVCGVTPVSEFLDDFDNS